MGATGSALTSDPVNLREGSVFESAVDLTLPGPLEGWAQTRTYRGQTPLVAGITRLGHHWFDGMTDMRIYLTWSDSFGSKGDDGSVPSGVWDAATQTWEYTYQLQFNARGVVPLKYVSTSNGLKHYEVPSDWPITVVDDPTQREFIVREKFSDKVYIFHDFHSEKAAHLRGRLAAITTRQALAAGSYGYEFTYANDGRLLQIIPPAPQDDVRIIYKYESVLTENVSSVQVWDGPETTGTLLMRVDYTYWDDVASPAADLGTSGCLVQVKASQRSSNDTGNNLSNVRYTQYRYDPEPDHYTYLPYLDDGVLRSVYDHAGIQQIVSEAGGASSPEDVLELPEAGGALDLLPYASRWFEYHDGEGYAWLDDLPDITSNVDTPWEENENLESKYGGSPYPENHELRVKAEHINSGAGGCSSCGVGEARITRQYHYMHVWQNVSAPPYYQWWIWHSGAAPRDINETRMIVVEDTLVHDDPQGHPDGRPLYRKIYALNDFSRKLREVFIEDPTQENLTCWGWAWTYAKADGDGDGIFTGQDDLPHLKHRVAEYRLPSAYNLTSDADLRKFLNPYHRDRTESPEAQDDWSNDEDRLRVNSGQIYVYEYNGEGFQSGVKIKRGRNGAAHYVSAADWGDGTSTPADRITATYVYPEKTTARGDGAQTKYEYTFWDGAKRQIKTKITKIPAVVQSQNGPASGSPTPNDATVIAFEEYYDNVGRLRWTKDGEGYVTYYSYSPSVGGVAYAMVDVNDPSSPGSDVVNGSAGAWLAWTVGGADANKPARGSGLPTGLGLATKIRFDAQGREFLRTDPRGATHFTAYQTSNGVDRVVRFPYWDNAAFEPRVPMQVSEFDATDRLAAVYELAPDTPEMDSGGSVPIGLDSALESADRISLTRHLYDPSTGHLTETRRYHDTSGDAEFVHFYRTYYRYDAEGRVGATIQEVESGKYQVDAFEYDALGRKTSRRRAVLSFVPVNHADAVTHTTLLSTITYDGGGVGDGHVTGTRAYHTASVYTDALYHRTFRGFLRGVERRYTSGSTADVTPYQAMDVDWLGRTTVAANYTTEPTWSTLVANEGDAAYVSSTSSGRVDRTDTFYDVLGRVYRTEHYPGTSANKLQTNNYYDRNGRLVCTGDKYSVHTEYVYDGAGRLYQTRVVKDAPTSPWTSGKFNYTAPAPYPGTSASSSGYLFGMEGGDAGMITFMHQAFDLNGNVIERHEVEVNHNDTTNIGINLAANDYVRTSVYSWYNEADQLIATADYGAGDGYSTTNTWMRTDPPNRNSTPPSWTDAAVYDGKALLTTYGYDANTGRQDLVASGVKKNGSDTTTMRTKTFFDDLGRRLFVVENWNGSYDPVSGSPSSSASSNRTAGWKYDGLGQVAELTAYNSNSTAQVTKYFYIDDYDASLVTNVIYPDSSDTTVSGTDQVKRSYNLDGSLASLTDQRGVVHKYGYNSRRQLEWDVVTSLGSSGAVDGTIRAIKREYFNHGKVSAVYSYPTASESPLQGTGTIQNGLWYNYYGETWNDSLAFRWSMQHHGVPAVGGPLVQSVRDFSVDGDAVLTGGNRTVRLAYPNLAEADFIPRDAGGNAWTNDDSLSDRLSRVAHVTFKPSGGSAQTVVSYKYNGTNRLVSTDYVVPDVKRETFDSGSVNDYDAFDRFGRTVRQQWSKYGSGAGVRDQFDYTHDYAGNRLSRDIPSGLYATNDRDETYSYDGLQRLAQANYGTYSSGFIADGSAKFRQKWGLDALGNWPTFQQDGAKDYSVLADNDFADATDSNQERTHNLANETTAIDEAVAFSWHPPVYDPAGNAVVIPMKDDPVLACVLKYDAWNRLVAVFKPDISEHDPFVRMDYDGLHRRIIKRTDNGTLDGIFDETRHYYYNEDWQVVEERVGADPATARIDVQYVWHPEYVDALALRFWDHDENPGTPLVAHYYLQDANYNVTAVTNASGAVVERYAYTPYGEVTILDDDFSVDANQISDVANVYLYTGRESDPETGIQHNRNRPYTPPLGRWLTRDPAGYADSNNLYQYVRSQPVIFHDPTGEQIGAFPNPWSPFQCKSTKQECLDWVTDEKSDLKWLKSLPDCPCSISRVNGEWTNPGANTWIDPEPPVCCHPGAAVCMRQNVSNGGPGQQCCYDKNGRLITGGAGAGTPDKVAPQGPIDAVRHYVQDVKYYNKCEKVGLLNKYHEARPPNNGNNCNANVVP